MYRIINEYLSKMNMVANDEVRNRIESAVSDLEEISRYSLTEHFGRYMLDLRIEDYCVDSAGVVFQKVSNLIGYSYSSIFVRFNEGSCVRYRFLTSKENKDGIYLDIMIHGK